MVRSDSGPLINFILAVNGLVIPKPVSRSRVLLQSNVAASIEATTPTKGKTHSLGGRRRNQSIAAENAPKAAPPPSIDRTPEFPCEHCTSDETASRCVCNVVFRPVLRSVSVNHR